MDDLGGMPKPQEIDRVLLEPVVFGGATGAVWAVRNVPDSFCSTAEDKVKMYFEMPAMHDSMKSTLDYIRTLPVFGEQRNLANIAVLNHRSSRLLDFAKHQAALHGIEELMMTSGIPYSCLCSEKLESENSNYRLIILPEIRLLGEKEAELLRNFVACGGRLLILGVNCGRFDEYRHERLDSVLFDISGVSCYARLDGAAFNPYGKGEVGVISCCGSSRKPIINMMTDEPGTMVLPPWPSHPEMIIGAIDRLLGKRQVNVSSEYKIGASIASVENKRIAVQLFSYASAPEPQGVKLTLDKALVSGQQCTVYMPNAKPYKLGCLIENESAIFKIDDFVRHAALIFEN
jgi:hypothetical protein